MSSTLVTAGVYLLIRHEFFSLNSLSYLVSDTLWSNFRLQFEREEGELEQFEDAETKIKTRMAKFDLERARSVLPFSWKQKL